MPNDRQPAAIDDIDLAILEALSDDARMPNNRLADQLGIAPSTCLARVRALRKSGVLRGFHADVDLAALGRPLQAMIAVRLTVHHREDIEGFTRAVRELPGVLSVFHVAGVNDYLVWVAASDARDPSVGRPRRDVAHLRAPPWSRALAEPERRRPGSAIVTSSLRG
jgi:DNA-binding Lrp family transcriptional regulator